MPDPDLLAIAQRRVGQVLCNKYRIDRVLGVGGMAVVYAATHRLQKECAIKILHPELSVRPDICQRFLREGVAANSVKHPGVVAVTDNDTAEDGAAFIVMELLDGAEVQALWDAYGRRMPVERVLAVAHQLLDVLAAAHAKSIVHRDIKPQNLFVTHEGQLKVLDFGIARVRDAFASGSSATHTGVLMGTPAFMAPEQAYAKASEIDAQTDLWAVGATMFTLLAGEYVHQGENPTQIMVQAATTPARSLGTVAPWVPGQVVALVDRALAFPKNARWPNAAAMRDAIAELHVALYGRALTRDALSAVWSDLRSIEGRESKTTQTSAGTRHVEGAGYLAPTRDSSLPSAPVGGTVNATEIPGPSSSARGGTQPASWAVPPRLSAPRLELVGSTTAQPVSSTNAPGTAPAVIPGTRRGVLLGAVIGGVVLVGAAATLAAISLGGTGSTAASPSRPSASVAQSPLQPPAPSAVPTISASAVSLTPLPILDAGAASSPTPHAASQPAVPPSPHPPAPPSPRPVSPPAPGPTCKWVQTSVDPDGTPHFQKVCH